MKQDGKIIFEIDSDAKKNIEFCATNNFEDANKEFIVEIPVTKGSSVTSQLKNSIHI